MNTLLIGCWLLAAGWGNNIKQPPHAVYVSVLEIKGRPGAGQAEMAVKLFADDLEDAVFHFSGRRPDLQTGDCRQGAGPVGDYLQAHLQVRINGRPVSFEFTGCERNDMTLWYFYTLYVPRAWDEVTIEADYLMELFPVQANVVNLQYGSRKHLFRLVKAAPRKQVEMQ